MNTKITRDRIRRVVIPAVLGPPPFPLSDNIANAQVCHIADNQVMDMNLLLRLHANVVIQGDERILNSFLSAVECPLGEVKAWLIQQCSDFLCSACSQAGDEPINPDCQRSYGQNKCEKNMDGRVPIPDKCYKESPKEN